MPDTTIARRYAQAMIEVADAHQVTDRIGADLAKFTDVLDAHDGLLRSALCTPVFTVEERDAVLCDLVPRLELHDLTKNLLRLANQNGRMVCMTDIQQAYADLADERAGRVRVVVSTADPLTPQLELEVQQAMEKVTGKKVVLDCSVDSSLLGGLIARVGGTVYDSSLRSRLQQIRASLLDTHIAADA